MLKGNDIKVKYEELTKLIDEEYGLRTEYLLKKYLTENGYNYAEAMDSIVQCDLTYKYKEKETDVKQHTYHYVRIDITEDESVKGREEEGLNLLKVIYLNITKGLKVRKKIPLTKLGELELKNYSEQIDIKELYTEGGSDITEEYIDNLYKKVEEKEEELRKKYNELSQEIIGEIIKRLKGLVGLNIKSARIMDLTFEQDIVKNVCELSCNIDVVDRSMEEEDTLCSYNETISTPYSYYRPNFMLRGLEKEIYTLYGGNLGRLETAINKGIEEKYGKENKVEEVEELKETEEIQESFQQIKI